MSSSAIRSPEAGALARAEGTGSPATAVEGMAVKAGLLLMGLLWLQLFYACIYGWRYGEYYDYGWYVPPLFFLCLIRLSKEWTTPASAPLRPLPLVLGGVGLFAVLAVVRSINRADPRWTLPIWVQAVGVVVASLWLVHRLGGPRAMIRSVPIWIFGCTAIALPTAVEQAFIGHLTEAVLHSSTSLLRLIGYPVEVIGDRLLVRGEMVRVTEGCSGIRSAQSFLMVSVFFGEWLRLRAAGRIGLVAAGFVTAWAFNSLRATALSVISVEHGELVFDEWHDPVGYIASAGGAAVLYLLALAVDRGGRRRARERKVFVERRPA